MGVCVKCVPACKWCAGVSVCLSAPGLIIADKSIPCYNQNYEMNFFNDFRYFCKINWHCPVNLKMYIISGYVTVEKHLHVCTN